MRAVVFDGIALGLQFGLLGVGLTLVYGLAGVLNLAQGQLAVLGAIVAALRIDAGSPVLPAVLTGLVVAGTVGLALDLTLMRPVYRRQGEERVLLGLLLMLGVSFIIEGVLVWRYPIEALTLRIGGDPVDILGVRMRTGSLLASAIALGVGAVLVVYLRYAATGKAVRSVIQDEEGAQLCGVSPAKVRAFVFALSGVLAALVAVTRSMTSPVTVHAGIDFTILALIVAVVGGLGSVSGAFLAGILLGIVNTVSAHYIGTYVTTIVLLGAVAVTIVLRPSGLLGAGAGVIRQASTVGRAGTSAVRAYAPVLLAVALVALLPLRYGDSRSMMGVVIGGVLFACYTIGFNLIFGSTGQLFLCTGALAGLGGFSSAILSDRHGLPLVLAMVLASLVAAAAGGLLSWIAVSRSLGVIFTGIVTLAFSLSFQNLLLGQRELTGGETGLVVEAGSDTLLAEQVAPFYVFVALLTIYLALFRALQRSHIGWAFRALRDDEIAAELAGVDVKRYRVFAGTLGSGMIGLAGALYAHSEGFISPSTFSFGEVDVLVIVMLAFGGIGSLLGPVVGAATFTALEEWMDSFNEYRLIIYGSVIVVLFLVLPRGVVPTVQGLVGRLRRRRARRSPAPAARPPADTLAPG